PEIRKCFTDYFSAPVVGSINCGDPEEEKEEVEQYVSLPTSIFGKGEFYLLRAQGTSMLDAGIKPGDLIVVRKQPTAEVGDIVVALDDNNQNTLKRFAGFDKETGKAVLLYQNEKDYPNKRILVDELVVQGISKNVISYI
ncbi:MAG: hypothetical protein LUD72_08365, partial [Bacteroidales bacterium]|nr:hypothetical protein [Bacteroidales bacterium]